MAIDLNADVGKILKDFLSGKKSDPTTKRGKKTLNEHYRQAILKTIIILCFLISICYAINLISSNPIIRDNSEFTSSEQISNELATLENNLTLGQSMLKKNKEIVSELINHFSEIEGSKNLFRILSVLASENNLAVKNITKGNTEDISLPANHQKNSVFLEIDGIYANYISFKLALLEQKPVLTINSEKIEVTTTSYGERKLSIKLEITDYSVDKKIYKDLL
ncbi:MAG: hypothetical protein SFT90_01170 [Rickettsiales bacterium]|nr:hypothetical protein [Rickettsiales bacterium]